jgi:hypothetical protein
MLPLQCRCRWKGERRRVDGCDGYMTSWWWKARECGPGATLTPKQLQTNTPPQLLLLFLPARTNLTKLTACITKCTKTKWICLLLFAIRSRHKRTRGRISSPTGQGKYAKFPQHATLHSRGAADTAYHTNQWMNAALLSSIRRQATEHCHSHTL